MGHPLIGCSKVIEGITQKVYISTNPAGAACKFKREGRQIATITPATGAAVVQKTKYDITVLATGRASSKRPT